MATNQGLNPEQQKLVEKNMRLIPWWSSKKYRQVHEDITELKSIAGYALFKAAATYIPDQVAFTTYFCHIADNALRMYWRTKNKQKKIKSISLEALVVETKDGNKQYIKDVLPASVNVEETIMALQLFDRIKTLDLIEQQVIYYRMQNFSEKAIGKALGISQSYACRILNRAKNKIMLEED